LTKTDIASRRGFLKVMGLSALSACVPTPAWAYAGPKKKRPNVILMMADDLGYEALACNGGTSYETPLLDKFAANGMRFTNCYSQPICTPSRVKIMTGRSNARNYRDFGDLDPNEITFGHIMKKAGYKTCVAGKWQLCGGTGHKGSFPKSSGFDESCMWAYSHDLPESARDKYTFFGKKVGKTSRYWQPAIVRNGEYVPTTQDDYGPDIYSGFIMDFIERNKDTEFFAYYPMTLTHSPFLATPRSTDRSVRAKIKSSNRFFEDMIQYTGVIIDRIISKLHALGIAENTLVMFTCDNGTGRALVSRMGDRLVHGGKGLPIDAGVHVPLIAYWPGTIKTGSVCTDLVDFSDFLPTLAELGEAALPTDRVLDGRSFLPRLKGEKGNPRNSVVVHYDKNPPRAEPQFRRVRFAYDGRYKLYLDGRMYEVPKDWVEAHPISVDGMSAAESAARDKLQGVLDAMPEWHPDNSFFKGEIGPEMKRYLRKYGVELKIDLKN
jgi:arylsulfatase A